MAPALEARSPVTELQVRMDCGGCVHKVKKAVHSVHGVHDIHVDFARQKLTVVGSADPEMVVKAIKKAGKFATICSHSEPAAEPGGSEPAADAADQPPSESPPETPEEPPKDAPQVTPSADVKDEAAEPEGAAEIHMVHHYPYSFVHREPWSHDPSGAHEIRYEEPFVMHSYGISSGHRPHPYVSAARDMRYGSGDGSQIATMFSDENPNACTII
ncbi:heavy metal-associated isoprenylated plant protein 6-like [Musa acuminata AAA Group]|uniref:heavy metal-associated isoprenylated plant protein 6-like n=1 Tax=Musa acuminata AAA Group TaxID=214697 RepID=UPI0031CFB808